MNYLFTFVLTMTYSSILPKFGICLDCSNEGDNSEKELVAKRCHNHYRLHKRKEQLAKQNLKLSIRKVGRTQDKELQNKIVTQTGLSYLISDLDTVVSRYLRIREANHNQYVNCYTCNRSVHWSISHCSHFISRQHLGTRWLLDNLRVACYHCNVDLYGNLEVYAANLEKEKSGTVEYLQNLAREVSKPNQSELKELLADFKSKLRLVESKLKK